MEPFEGRIEQNGKVVVDNVTGTIYRHDPSMGLKSWSGLFTLPQGRGLMPGMCHLVLDDGRSATILITSAYPSSHSSTVVQFQGAGPPP
jgi:hypothetical protein